MDLTRHDHRVDDVAEIVDRREAINPCHTSLWIDFDFAHVSPGGIGEVGWIVERIFVETRLELVQRIVMRDISGQCHRSERDFLVSPGHHELAVLEFDIGVSSLEQMSRDFLAFGDNLIDCFYDRRTANGQRTAAVGAHSEGHATGIAVDDFHALDRNAKLGCHDLREGRLMALTMTM